MSYLRMGKVKQVKQLKQVQPVKKPVEPIVNKSIYALEHRLDSHSRFVVSSVVSRYKYRLS